MSERAIPKRLEELGVISITALRFTGPELSSIFQTTYKEIRTGEIGQLDKARKEEAYLSTH